MTLLNPIWLLGLLGISVPLIIHLLSRKEGPVIKIGSLRHLQVSQTSRFKSIRLNEILLLLLRSVIITTLVLLLCNVVLNNTTQNKDKWILIDPNYQLTYQPIIDSLKLNGYEVRLFQSGFPPESNNEKNSSPSINKLLQDLVKQPVSNVVIIAPWYIENLTGPLYSLPENTTWIPVIPIEQHFIYTSKKNGRDSLLTRHGKSSATGLFFTTQKQLLPSDSTIEQDIINVRLTAETGFEYDRLLLEACLRTINKHTTSKAIIQFSDTLSSPDWIIHLGNTIPDQSTANKVYIEESISNSILEKKSSNTWHFTKRLTSETAITHHLVYELANVLLHEKIPVGADKRILPEKFIATSSLQQREQTNVLQRAADSYVLILFLILLCIERFIAWKRNQ